MESKKRKREGEPPRVTYDAATRTFDRLFKEDSLDAMKTVVRKKLGLLNSVPVYLSQWREGKAVDLEDDEDFEAFSAAARSSTAVVVKVVLGENQVLPPSEENEVSPSTTKRKCKKKSKGDGSASPPAPVTREPSVDNVNPESSSETVPALKKRRVSFAEGVPDVRNLLGEKPKKKDSILALDKSVTPAVDVSNAEPEQSEKEEEPVKKKKSKKNKVADGQTEEAEEQTKSIESEPTTGKESEKKSIANSEGTKAPSDDSMPDGTATKPKKSKKRSRTSTAPEASIQDETPTTEQSAPTTKPDDGERPTKKAKKKAADSVGSKPTAAVVTVDTPNIANPTVETQIPITQPPSVPDTTIPEPTKKPWKRKQKTAAEPEESPIYEALKSNPADKKLEDASSSSKLKKSATSKPGDVGPSTEVVPEPTPIVRSTPPTSDNATTSTVPVTDEPENTPAVKKPKKSKQKADATKNTETLSEPKEDVPPPADTGTRGKSKKSKDKGKDTESPVVVVVAEDNVNASVASVAKTPKKGGKQKKNAADTVEQSGTAEGQYLDPAKLVAMDEVTRLAVLNVLKMAAEKTGNKNSPSLPAAIQPTSTQAHPASSDSSSVDKAPLNVTPISPLASRSTIIEPPPKAPVAPESSKSVKKPSASLSKLAKESSKCPICENSPLHARSRCPVVKSGIRAMRKKIVELEQETSEEGAESRSSVILELQGIIERRTRKSRVSEIIKPIASPDVESKSPEKEAQVAVTSTNAPAPAPSADSKSPVEAEVAAISASQPTPLPTPTPASTPAPAPANPRSPPPSQPRFSLSQKFAPPPVSSQAKSSQRASTSAQGSLSTLSQPRQTAEAPLPINLMGFGDVSLFTDQDLDALIRGPRLSVKNVVPNSDTEDESEQEEEAVLEEDVAVENKSARNASRVEYPSSSDEGEEEEEESPADSPMDVDHPTTAAIIEEADVDDNVEESRGDLSFREINDLGSSVEPDRTADIAVHAVVGADLASLNVRGLSQDNGPKDDAKERSDGAESQAPSPTNSPAPPEVIEDVNTDPIEPSDVPLASQPEPIASDDDEPPVESTPAVRTRSQRIAMTKKAAPKVSQPPASQSKVNGSDEAQVGDTPKPRTRSLMKLTELPVPPNPSARIIRQAAVATPRTRRQLAQEQSKEREVTPEETEIAGRTRRAAAAAKAKTPAKAPAKTPAKTSARAAKTTAKPLSKQGKAVAANGVDAVTTNSGPGVVSSVQELESSQAPPSSPGKSTASWAFLRSSVPSQVDETAGMIDELLSSPTAMANTSPRDHSRISQKSMSVNGSQPEDPLFIPAESQQSFPYSQYPDAPPMNQGTTSPNDSDDEEEVLAAVVKTKPGSMKQAFRSLKEIASQPSLFAPRLSQIMKPVNEPQGEDLYGRKGRESEESDSGSDDSDDDDKPASHIPASRRAGVSQPKKK